MILIERTQVMNFENAMRGARNPLNSWDRSDSHTEPDGTFVFGENDLSLAKRLCKAGSDHRKFIRQIFVSVDLTAPLYWWKEFDTYKVGTVANSTSTMHKLHAKPIEAADFSAEKLVPEAQEGFEKLLVTLESLRRKFVETKDKDYWYSLIQLLPESYNQMRTVTMNYENLLNQYFARRGHKLEEWHVYCAWVESLPYFKELFLEDNENA